MNVVNTFSDVRDHEHGTIGLVPTMGFLHEGHLALIDEAAARCDTVVVSVFVNPLQFEDPDDLETYPDDLERDVELAADHGADVVFAPPTVEMYPTRQRTTVTVQDVVDEMEGRHRQDHFTGVATVVTKLLSGVQPDIAFFGRKDAQQLAVVTTMTRELSIPVEIVGLPTVREHDGLALSSRNTRLSDRQRSDALALSQGLFAAADLFVDGQRRSDALVEAVRRVATGAPGVGLEYIALADTTSAGLIDTADRPSFLAVAARVGSVRLIDNVFLDGSSGAVDIGVRLEHPSILYGGTTCC